jgi:hypothetical protein
MMLKLHAIMTGILKLPVLTATVLLLTSCLAVNRDLFRRANDMESLQRYVAKIPLNLRVVKNNGFLWITNIDSNQYKQIHETDEQLLAMFKDYRDIYRYNLLDNELKVIILYLKKSDELKTYSRQITGEPQWGPYGYVASDYLKPKLKRDYFVICASEDVGAGTVLHEMAHILNWKNLPYLPCWLDESLAKAIPPFDTTVSYINHSSGKVTKVSYNALCLGEYLRTHNNKVFLGEFISFGRKWPLLPIINKQSAMASSLMALLWRYLDEREVLSDCLMEVEKQGKFDLAILETCLGESGQYIQYDFVEWLKLRKYLPPPVLAF